MSSLCLRLNPLELEETCVPDVGCLQSQEKLYIRENASGYHIPSHFAKDFTHLVFMDRWTGPVGLHQDWMNSGKDCFLHKENICEDLGQSQQRRRQD